MTFTKYLSIEKKKINPGSKSSIKLKHTKIIKSTQKTDSNDTE